MLSFTRFLALAALVFCVTAEVTPVLYSACSSVASCNDTQALRAAGMDKIDFNITWDGVTVPYAQLNCGGFTFCRKAVKEGDVFTATLYFMNGAACATDKAAAELKVDLSQPRGTQSAAACGVMAFDANPVSVLLGGECDAASTCGGHGACDDAGRCLCEGGYYGDDGCYEGSAPVNVTLAAASEPAAYASSLGAALGIAPAAVWVLSSQASEVSTVFLAREGATPAAALTALRSQAKAESDNAALLAMGVTSVQFDGEAPITVEAYQKDESSGLGAGAVVGIVVGVLAVIGLAAFGAVLYRRRQAAAALKEPLVEAPVEAP